MDSTGSIEGANTSQDLYSWNRTKYKLVILLSAVGVILMVGGYVCFTQVEAARPLYGMPRSLFFGVLFGGLGLLHLIPVSAFAATDAKWFALFAVIANSVLAVFCIYLLGFGLIGLLFQVGMPLVTWNWFNELFRSRPGVQIERGDIVRRVALLLISAVLFSTVGPYSGSALILLWTEQIIPVGAGLWLLYVFGLPPALAARTVFGFCMAYCLTTTCCAYWTCRREHFSFLSPPERLPG